VEEECFCLIVRLMGYCNPMRRTALSNLGQKRVACQPRSSWQPQTRGLCQCRNVAALHNHREPPRFCLCGDSNRLSLSLGTADAMVEMGDMQRRATLHAQLQQQME